jgi:signal recognition particle subunit SRP54
MGSLRDLFEKMPFFGGQLPEGINLDDKELVRIEAMISSMTANERKSPELFVVTSWETITNPNGQQMRRRKGADYDERRVRRVARGSGRKENEVKELLNKFAMMRQMMTQMGAQSGLLGKIPGFKQIAQMRQMTKAASGIDLGQLMSAAGMPQGERRFTVPKTNADKNKEKRKRKEARKQRKKNKRR